MLRRVSQAVSFVSFVSVFAAVSILGLVASSAEADFDQSFDPGTATVEVALGFKTAVCAA